MKTIILDYSFITPAYFKAFTPIGGLLFTHEIGEALDIASFSNGTNTKIIKRMISAWYAKPFSRLGFEVVDVSYKNEIF